MYTDMDVGFGDGQTARGGAQSTACSGSSVAFAPFVARLYSSMDLPRRSAASMDHHTVFVGGLHR